MKIINLQQGTSEWHHYRRSHFNASDAPAMMGCSLYETRDELIHRLATGEEKPVSEETQRIFDEGHRREGLMRPIVEETINEDLSPVTGEEEPLPPHRRPMSASFDGLSILHDVVWECKSLNNTIRGAKTVKDLHLCYKVQMEQQMLLCGAKKAFFTGAKFDGDKLTEFSSFWYQSDPDLAKKIVAGWEQLEKEIQEYQVRNHVEAPKADEVRSLPIAVVSVAGSLVSCNLDQVTPVFDKFLASAVRVMVTDDDFALAESQAKKAREAAKQCRGQARSIVDQMASIGEVTRVLEEYAAKFDSLGLFQEKGVKSQKELLKNNARKEYEKKWYDYRQMINDSLGIIVQMDMRDEPDFAEVMKGQRMMSSVHNKLNSELARSKIALDEIALKMTAKLTWFRSSDRPNIFHDLSALVARLEFDDFQSLVNSRIEAHKKDEEAKIHTALDDQKKELEKLAQSPVSIEIELMKAPGQAHIQMVDKVDQFIALGGIPDDLIPFARLLITRFIAWDGNHGQ